MKEIDLVITPRDPIILRDGRPFGEAGTSQSGHLNWPRPGTVIGMVRTVIGTLRDSEFFNSRDSNHISEIRQIALKQYLPAQKDSKEYYSVYIPAPADAVAFSFDEDDERIEFKPMLPSSLRKEMEGTDIPWKNYQYAWLEDLRKPLKNVPLFWKWEYFRQWLLNENLPAPVLPEEIGLMPPQSEDRTHLAIETDTGAAAEAKLFTTLGVRFKEGTVIATRIFISKLDRLPHMDIANLGGDRRPVFLEWGKRLVDWPLPPEGIGKTNWLRLVLITPGIFNGGWAPDWLVGTIETGKYFQIPGTEFKVRLRSACIPQWLPCHGWDMSMGKEGAPKPMRKMVPAGAVYFVETDAADPSAVASSLWNVSLCENEQDQKDGFGRVLVGNWIRQ